MSSHRIGQRGDVTFHIRDRHQIYERAGQRLLSLLMTTLEQANQLGTAPTGTILGRLMYMQLKREWCVRVVAVDLLKAPAQHDRLLLRLQNLILELQGTVELLRGSLEQIGVGRRS